MNRKVTIQILEEMLYKITKEHMGLPFYFSHREALRSAIIELKQAQTQEELIWSTLKSITDEDHELMRNLVDKNKID